MAVIKWFDNNNKTECDPTEKRIGVGLQMNAIDSQLINK